MIEHSFSETTTTLVPLAVVDGWPITVPSLAAAVERTLELAEAGRPSTVFTLNLDHLVKLRRGGLFRQAYSRASLVTADGAPIVWLARLQGHRLERTTGADLVAPLAIAAAERGLKVFLFGTSGDALARAGERLAELTDHRLNIAGTFSPSASFDPTGPEADAALDRIRASGASLCLVALGAPKQEVFAARAQALGVPAAFVCIGAALDFIAGAQVRAPLFMQRHGLEWLWRLATNPRRLAVRYAHCAIVLADLVLIAPLRQRWSRSVPS